MSKTLEFKVYLTKENIPGKAGTEIRRFIIANDATVTFVNVERHLKKTFPTVSWPDSRITWRDSDGDDIVISTDYELRLALYHMEGQNPCKLYVFEFAKKTPEGLLNENDIKPQDDN